MLNYAADNGIEAEVRFLARYLIAVVTVERFVRFRLKPRVFIRAG